MNNEKYRSDVPNRENLLLKRDDSKTFQYSDFKKIEKHKQIIKEICNILLEDTRKYNPKNSIEKIYSFITEEEKMERIFYSEISSYIFDFDEEKRGRFTTNIDNLLRITCENDKIFSELHYDSDTKKDIVKIIIKIFDHSHLAILQIENVEKIMASTISQAKQEIKKEVNEMEKQYISILGIFASIILAFVGGITFSTSILQNIHNASIYRIIFICSILSLTLINIFYILLSFIASINKLKIKDILPKKLYLISNVIIITIMVLDIFAWIVELKLLHDDIIIPYIHNYLKFKFFI